MKKGAGWITVILIIAALAVVKIFFLAPENKGPGGPDKSGKSMPSPVSVTVVHPEESDNRLFVTGNILASEEITLVPETQGKVSGVFFTEGSSVSKGQLLVKLNDHQKRL